MFSNCMKKLFTLNYLNKTITFIILFFIVFSHCDAQNALKKNISFFGSSVCKGVGAADNKGYAWLLKYNNVIDSTQFNYFNVSTGGDNTIKIEKFNRLATNLYPTNPDIVVLGLSLGNEGIRIPFDEDGREKILEQYRSRLLILADSLDKQGVKPIIVNCYPHLFFNEDHYRFTKRMNRIINTWNYPSVNVLGSIDDGLGKWAEGYSNDPWHPNFKGHLEMSYAFVPSLFEAIFLGKKTPNYDWSPSYYSLSNTHNESKSLCFSVEKTMHSFSLSFKFMTSENGIIAGYSMNNFDNDIKVDGYYIKYSTISIPFDKKSKDWTHIVLTHNYANETTSLFVNGKLAGFVKEKLSPNEIYIGGIASIDIKDLMLHRSSINAEEVKDLFNHKMLQSSLEFYNPFTKPVIGKLLTNLAQSLSTFTINKNIEVKHVLVNY